MISQRQILFEQQKRFDFDDSRALSNEAYRTLTCSFKTQFDQLVSQVFQSGIRNSINRCIRTAVAILVCTPRFALWNTLLAMLFQLLDTRDRFLDRSKVVERP